MIPPSWIVTGVVVLAAGGYIAHCEHSKGVLAKAAALALAQERENDKQALRDIKSKERSDENYTRNMARLAADIKRLRDASPGYVPAIAAAPGGAAGAVCFESAEFAAALQRYRDGVLGVAAAGAEAAEGLDEARRWAQAR